MLRLRWWFEDRLMHVRYHPKAYAAAALGVVLVLAVVGFALFHGASSDAPKAPTASPSTSGGTPPATYSIPSAAPGEVVDCGRVVGDASRALPTLTPGAAIGVLRSADVAACASAKSDVLLDVLPSVTQVVVPQGECAASIKGLVDASRSSSFDPVSFDRLLDEAACSTEDLNAGYAQVASDVLAREGNEVAAPYQG